ncbi:MAG TPA: SMC-Scp complex subunit ScpB [Candidatus Omnitrophota bacterium]|nr:SMC-Scp complex subunit ScpB [Candidatus Omnitrophota bacterium]
MESKTAIEEIQEKAGNGARKAIKMDEAAFKSLREELEEKILEELPSDGLRSPQVSVRIEKIEEIFEGNENQTKRIVEALLFASSKPLTVNEIKKVLRGIRPAQIEKVILELKEEYVRDGRSFKIQEVAGGYEISSDPKYAPWIMKLELHKRARQASQSALETLAILAYKQPATRQEIEDLRGVDITGVIATLLEKGLIRIVGRKEVPGRPFLYGTTEKFLEHFGLKALTDLPEIQEVRNLVEKAVPREKLLGTHEGKTVEMNAGEEGACVPGNSGPAAGDILTEREAGEGDITSEAGDREENSANKNEGTTEESFSPEESSIEVSGDPLLDQKIEDEASEDYDRETSEETAGPSEGDSAEDRQAG